MAGVYFGSFLPTKGVGGEGAPGGTGWEATRRGRACGLGAAGSEGPGERPGAGRARGVPSGCGEAPVPSQLKVTAKSQQLATLSAASWAVCVLKYPFPRERHSPKWRRKGSFGVSGLCGQSLLGCWRKVSCFPAPCVGPLLVAGAGTRAQSHFWTVLWAGEVESF